MGVTTNLILPPEQLQLVLSLTQMHLPGVEVWAYGSRVRGNPRRYSDLDLVAFADSTQKPLADNFREALEESDLPIRVDLFLWDDLPESFRNRIREGYAVLQRAGAPAVAEIE